MMNFVETSMKFWEASMNYYLETGKNRGGRDLGRFEIVTRINTD